MHPYIFKESNLNILVIHLLKLTSKASFVNTVNKTVCNLNLHYAREKEETKRNIHQNYKKQQYFFR